MHLFHKHRSTCFFVLALIILSALVHFGRIGASVDGVDLSTDAANYASIAAANTHPQAFVKDPAYDDEKRYGVHDTITTSFLPLLTQEDNFGLAYLQPTGVQFFLHGLAFYLLGLYLLHKPWQAVFFTMIMSQAYWLTFGTYWGNGYYDYLPRSTFEVFYAFFIIAAFKIRHSPKLWPLFMLAIGLMAYVHSISTLPTAFGFWLGFVLCRPKHISITRHLLWLIFCGFCFILVICPIVFDFMRSGIVLSDDDVLFMREIVALRYNIEFTHYWSGLLTYITRYSLALLFPLGIASYFILKKWGEQEDRERIKHFLMWFLGVAFCAGLFIIDQEVGRIFNRKPYEFDLIRVVRFWIFFAICLIFMAINVLLVKFSTLKNKKRLTFIHVLLFIILYASGAPQKLLISLPWYWHNYNGDSYSEAYAKSLQRNLILTALQENTKEGDLIFDPNGDRAIRYKALRALIYSWQDCSIYYYAKDLNGLKTWYDIQKNLKTSPTAYINLALEHKADYLISHRPQDREMLEKIGTIVWANSQALLLRLDK